jgi:hypothetical protein
LELGFKATKSYKKLQKAISLPFTQWIDTTAFSFGNCAVFQKEENRIASYSCDLKDAQRQKLNAKLQISELPSMVIVLNAARLLDRMRTGLRCVFDDTCCD